MTRDRAAAIERAIASYRRVFNVTIHNTAAEMMADLIGWHRVYVDSAVDLKALFQLAERRANVVESERDSAVRPPVEDTPQELPDDLFVRFPEGDTHTYTYT